jgi:L,D-peptidoglycan transpeptidase YkuD (ErfK/YbiS/YcfS/YnhG family)
MNASYCIAPELTAPSRELAIALGRSYLLAMRLVILILFVLSSPAIMAATDPLQTSRQCLVVVADNWNAKTGTLRAFERTSSRSGWQMRGHAIPVVLGKKGMAWGRGLVEFTAAVRKVEGDNKAPAGIFRLGPAFGYAPRSGARWIKLPYIPLTKNSEGIDDPRSRYYNKLVDRSKIAKVDWRTSEQMLRSDVLYKWGVVVAHNSANTPGAGSCIFLHVWKNSSSATAGCTAMPEQNLVDLLRWVDPSKRPVLIQMPRAEFADLRSHYRVPSLAEKPSR